MMLKNKLWIAIGPLVILLSISGCAQTYLNLTTRNARELKVFEKKDTTVVFVAMTHIAKPTYFEQVRLQIDSLRNEGFIFVKEGVYYEKDTEPQQRDTLQLKMRQLLGFSVGDYSDKENKTLPNFLKNGKYIMQRDSIIGLKDTDLHIDMSYNDMIKAHEKKFGPILLTSCDFETSIFEKYKCRDGNAYRKSFYVVDRLRTDRLFEDVMKLNDTKIAIVYGAGHFKWFYPEMIKVGYNYKNKKLRFG